MKPLILMSVVVAGLLHLAASDEVYTQPDGTRLANPNDGYAAEEPDADPATADSKVFDSYKDQLLEDYVGLEVKIGDISRRSCVTGVEKIEICSLSLDGLSFLLCLCSALGSYGSYGNYLSRRVYFPVERLYGLPVVTVGIKGLGQMLLGSVQVEAINVTSYGFSIAVSGGYPLSPYSVTVQWIACSASNPLDYSVRNLVLHSSTDGYSEKPKEETRYIPPTSYDKPSQPYEDKNYYQYNPDATHKAAVYNPAPGYVAAPPSYAPAQYPSPAPSSYPSYTAPKPPASYAPAQYPSPAPSPYPSYTAPKPPASYSQPFPSYTYPPSYNPLSSPTIHA